MKAYGCDKGTPPARTLARPLRKPSALHRRDEKQHYAYVSIYSQVAHRRPEQGTTSEVFPQFSGNPTRRWLSIVKLWRRRLSSGRRPPLNLGEVGADAVARVGTGGLRRG